MDHNLNDKSHIEFLLDWGPNKKTTSKHSNNVPEKSEFHVTSFFLQCTSRMVEMENVSFRIIQSKKVRKYQPKINEEYPLFTTST